MARRRRRQLLAQLALFLFLSAVIELFCRARLVAEGYETGSPVATLDPDRGWRLRQTVPSGEINDEGLRDGPVHPPLPNEVRILCLGGSVTQGFGLRMAETYEVGLHTRLKRVVKRGTPVCVMNAGISGYASYQYTRLLYEVGELYKPDIIIVMGGWNEVDAALPVSPADVYGFRPSSSVRRLLYHSSTYRYMCHKLLDTQPQRLDDYEATADNLGLIQRFAREHDARLLVTFEAHRNYKWLAMRQARDPAFALLHKQNEASLTRVRDVFRQASERMDVPFLDINTVFERAIQEGVPERVLFVPNDPLHPSAQGSAWIADALLETLVRLGWVPRGE